MPSDVNFSSIDGLRLSGHLYAAASRGPGVVMLPGFACVKEMFLPDIASALSQAGITVLTVDPRNTGASEGLPRQELNPKDQVSDLSDALTFLSQQPTVDPKRLALWGFSFGGAVVLNAASLDHRVKGVITIGPLTDFSFEGTKSKVLAKVVKDRISQVQGNPPFLLPVLNEDGTQPVKFGATTTRHDYEVLVLGALKTAPTYRNETTLQSYYHIISWAPYALIQDIPPSSVLLITPGNDTVSPVEKQDELFQRLSGTKQRHIEPNKGHMDVLSGDSFAPLVDIQVKYLQSL